MRLYYRMTKFVVPFNKQKTGQYSANVKLKLLIGYAMKQPCINVSKTKGIKLGGVLSVNPPESISKDSDRNNTGIENSRGLIFHTDEDKGAFCRSHGDALPAGRH
jgi:hypothetical protein